MTSGQLYLRPVAPELARNDRDHIPLEREKVVYYLKSVALLVASVISLSVTTPLTAQDINHLADKAQLTLSGAAIMLGSKMTVDGETTQGTNIDVENILGLSKTSVQPRIAVDFKPSRRHDIEVGYQFVRRSAQKSLAQDFVFRDSTYHVGEDVHTAFDSDQLFLNYRYAFSVGPRSEYGFGLGLGALFLDLNLDATAATGGGATRQFSNSKTLTAPTGSLGFYGKWRAWSSSYFTGDLRAVRVNVSKLDATIYEGGLGYRYFFTRKFGFEAGYGISSFDVKLRRQRDTGEDIRTFVTYSLQNLRLGMVTSL